MGVHHLLRGLLEASVSISRGDTKKYAVWWDTIHRNRATYTGYRFVSIQYSECISCFIHARNQMRYIRGNFNASQYVPPFFNTRFCIHFLFHSSFRLKEVTKF
jgi:hypothetical protein